MAAWLKSLQCNSKAVEDVINPNPKQLLSTTSCKSSSQNLKDVINNRRHHHHHHRRHHNHHKKQPTSDFSRSTKPKSSFPTEPHRTTTYLTRPIIASVDHLFPSLTELTKEHPSRNVVEIIFHTSWSDKALPVRVEMIFKVQNRSKTVNRFEEYREMVKSRASDITRSGGWEEENGGRCLADGNEMMRFYCLGQNGGAAIYDGAWPANGGMGSAICTFSGSGRAHESAGGGRGRKAMLVCRVIAGRISKRVGLESLLDPPVGFDSVSWDNGDLFVYDTRSVLPCFLIIYKL